jgi:hypothetical protein
VDHLLAAGGRLCLRAALFRSRAVYGRHRTTIVES